MVRRSDFGYPDFTRGTPVASREFFADRMWHQYGWAIDPGRDELTAQVAQALCALVLAVTGLGEAIVTHTPAYGPQPYEVIQRRAKVVLQPGSYFGEGFDSYARLNFGTNPQRLARIPRRIRRVLDLEP